jgi:hypothetical protein
MLEKHDFIRRIQAVGAPSWRVEKGGPSRPKRLS